MQAKEHYLNEYERAEPVLAGATLPWLKNLRRAALEQFNQSGFPGPKDERWKYTRMQVLEKRLFARSAPNGTVQADDLKNMSALNGAAHSLVFVNGHYAPELSQVGRLPAGAVVMGLAGALEEQPDKVEPYLGRRVDMKTHPFAALNTAFMTDGAYVYLPRGVKLEQPVLLVYQSTDWQEGKVAHLRNLIVAEDGSQAQIIEIYVGADNAGYFTNAVTEIVTGKDARIEHCKLQQEGMKAFHVAGLHVYQRDNSVFTSHSVSLGGLLVRNDIDAVLDASGVECHLNGLYMAGGRQHVDNHTFIDHAKPHCLSREFYKGVLDGHARAVFNGAIIVRQDAQKTDAQQANKNLLLSEDAEIDTKPQLEIYADDVKCAHGAAVGQIDQNAVFYLRSRGLGEAEARSLLTYAFAEDVVGRIRYAPVRSYIENMLISRLPDGRRIREMME